MKRGDKLGPYEIVCAVGKGGMGEVWRARDSRLGRDVAIKVSGEQFSDRFEKEAHAIAALNHPNICTLFDVGPDYLVMEFIEGPTLAERISVGPLSLDETLRIAKQIADALEAADEKAIVHRDLKPANVKIRPDGSVKVLDFGLAKAGEASEVTGDSPTLMTVGTQAGMILGTAGYMSPEQARGQVVDKRADIWAFGVVLYEMLTGKRLFDGATVSDSLAAILREEPDLTLVPAKTRRLLASCLEKDPKRRLRDIGDWALLLQPSLTVSARRARLPWLAAAGLGLALAASLYFLAQNTNVPETRLDIVTPPTSSPESFALSPDGRKIAYVATSDGASRLWVRLLDSISAQPLPGTENAVNPFWSPDSRSLGFSAEQKLKRIDLGGGKPQTLTELSGTAAQGTWNADGVILFFPGVGGPLYRISAAGGQATTATTRGTAQNSHRVPRFLPGGRQFLFASTGAVNELWLGSLDGTEPRRITALAPGTDSAAESPAPGWVVRVRQNVLSAQRFDSRTGRLSGDPVTLAQAVGIDPNGMAGTFSVAPFGSGSSFGTIAWRIDGPGRRQLIWFNRAGQDMGTFGAPDDSILNHPELSPDGKRAAVTRGPAGSRDIWMLEGARTRRFTFDPADDLTPIWSPDGALIVFRSNRTGASGLYQKPADGSGKEELLFQSAETKRLNSWSPDGRFILYDTFTPNNGQDTGDLMILPMTDRPNSTERKPYPFLSTPFNEQQGVFSPDGKWVAYQSNESGRNEIYARPFPGPGAQWQISVGGGISPRWRADGKELYYIAPDNKLMAAAVNALGAIFVPGVPAALFQTHITQIPFRPQYDVARYGRFLINTDLQDTSTEPIHLLLNWHPPK